LLREAETDPMCFPPLKNIPRKYPTWDMTFSLLAGKLNASTSFKHLLRSQNCYGMQQNTVERCILCSSLPHPLTARSFARGEATGKSKR
jgi:hypothetical protein